MRAYDKINSYISQVSYYGNQSKIVANITTSQDSVLQKINRYTTNEEHIDTIMDIMDTVDILMPWETQADDGCPSLEYEHTSGWDANSQTISSYLSQAESLLSQVEQLNNAQNINASLTSQQATLEQKLTGINQQIESVQQQIEPIQSAVNSFNISTTINPMSPAQKTHLLQKSWAQNDELSKSIVNLIKDQVFEPHYTNGANISLVETALSSGDMSLFELLIAKGLKFDQISRIGKTFFAIVQESNNDTFIKKMIDTKQDFSNSLASLITKGEAAKLAKLFDFDPELTKKTYEGHSLLKIAIAKDQRDIAEKIPDKNPESANPGIIKTALAKGNYQAVKLFTNNDSDLKNAFICCLKHNRVEFINKMLSIKSNLLSDIAGALSGEQALSIYAANNQVLKIYDDQSNNLLYYSLTKSNVAATAVFLSHDAKGLKDCNGQNLLLKIMNADSEPETQIEAFKVLFNSGVPVYKARYRRFGV